MGRCDHPGEGSDADPLQARHHHFGFAGYNIWLFVLCSIVARGGRFFVVAVLLNRYATSSVPSWKNGSASGLVSGCSAGAWILRRIPVGVSALPVDGFGLR